ncbi:hypothetical protein VNO77_19913 [Canavalia gladiata]|uniref:Uncharacterized protein n=1 Tax=Canavalia gladiata TaxID=3824 RepID=A0AAN9QKX9_CANGL
MGQFEGTSEFLSLKFSTKDGIVRPMEPNYHIVQPRSERLSQRIIQLVVPEIKQYCSCVTMRRENNSSSSYEIPVVSSFLGEPFLLKYRESFFSAPPRKISAFLERKLFFSPSACEERLSPSLASHVEEGRGLSFPKVAPPTATKLH